VGAILCNDDWGFNSQTMLPPHILKECVFPVYKRIVENAHRKGKYAILHSCGYYKDIMDDIINYMKFDGRHSYEDKITPVEEAYDELHHKIAVLGGIDVNFLARSTPDEIYIRCKNMVNRSKSSGGYALGSGNSVPDYISNENYLAMIKAAIED
jgi:uroporphyrinogen decarboxylase